MNVFICQTPFQLYFTEYFINNTDSSKKNLIIFSQGKNRTNNELITYFDLRKTSKAQFIYKHLKAKKKIESLAQEHKENLTFFIPHTGGLLANFIYHSKTFLKLKIKVNLLYEGVLYFFDYHEDYASFIKKRAYIGRLIGIDYQYEPIILPVDSDRINKIYTPFPKFTIGKEEKKHEIILSNKKRSPKNKTSSCLILGGPIEFAAEIYNKILEDVIRDGYEKVYYKGHHAFSTSHPHMSNIFAETAKNNGVNFEEIDSDFSIEELIGNSSYNAIMSYVSSALINIKIIFNDDIKLFAYNKSLEEQGLEQIIDIFEKINVKVVNV